MTCVSVKSNRICTFFANKHLKSTKYCRKLFVSAPDVFLGATIRVVATPGHTEDHASFFLEEEGALFTGDAVLGEGATTFEDFDNYLNSLRKMLDIPSARTMYPGHGGVIRDARGRLNAYISTLATRESSILNRLKRERDKGRKGISTIRLVYKLYGDKDLLTQLAGAQVVVAHLKKLYDMGVVDFKPSRLIIPDRWTLKKEVTDGVFSGSSGSNSNPPSPKAIGMSVNDFNSIYGNDSTNTSSGSRARSATTSVTASGSQSASSTDSSSGSGSGSKNSSPSPTKKDLRAPPEASPMPLSSKILEPISA